MNVVSIALFGERTRYAQYLSAFVRAHLTLFPRPAWELRIHHDAHNAGGLPRALADRGLVRLVEMPSAPLTKAMMWRLAPIWTEAEYVFCRDVDALPTPRDRVACDRFVASGCDVHTCHDSVSHDGILGGICGFNAPMFRAITGLESLDHLYALAARTDEEWATHGTDQHVLNALCLGWGSEGSEREAGLWAHGKRLTVFEHRYAGWANGRPGPATRKPSLWATVSEAMPDGADSPVFIANTLSAHLGAAGFDHEAAVRFYDKHGDPATMRAVRDAEREAGL